VTNLNGLREQQEQRHEQADPAEAAQDSEHQ
jgi:hypothetical protein